MLYQVAYECGATSMLTPFHRSTRSPDLFSRSVSLDDGTTAADTRGRKARSRVNCIVAIPELLVFGEEQGAGLRGLLKDLAGILSAIDIVTRSVPSAPLRTEWSAITESQDLICNRMHDKAGAIGAIANCVVSYT